MSPLLTVEDVARRLQLSRWLVYDLVKAGRLKAVRLTPGRLRFTEAAVRAAEGGQGVGPRPTAAAEVP
jgi:excisionase family DNA binding protein